MSGLNRPWAVVAAAIGAAAVVTSGVAMASAGAEPDVAVVAAAQAQPTTHTSPTPIPPPATKPTRPARPTAEPEHVFLGEPVRTGVNGQGGELVFRFREIDIPELPDIHFGLFAGRTDAHGVFAGKYGTNEAEGSDKAPGFHAASIASDLGRIPAFGYYSGPVAKVTAKIGRKTVQAHQANWNLDASIKVWWFDYTTVEPTDLAAFDAAGKPLPLGNNQFHRG
ncbi:MAG TPA: hypothetical protein VM677_33535 [Actinokineospora sp.]|jgi:hypothetical protein|nr:hypothetical protein [Actinokineospora sp.]